MDIYTYLIVVLLLKQDCICALQYCPEAVASVEVVNFCPTSEKELVMAAKRKNCDKLAISQNCSSIENFVYHCTINSYRNATLEVCAPKRTILGHCTEFNIVGGVIQDQHSAPCNVNFPKCDKYYTSNDAYKYDDCYKLVQSARGLQNETTTEKNWIKTGYIVPETLLVCLLVFMVAVTVAIVGVVTYLVFRRRCIIAQSDKDKNKKDQRSTKADLDDPSMQQLLNGNSTLSATSPVINPNVQIDERKKKLDTYIKDQDMNLQKKLNGIPNHLTPQGCQTGSFEKSIGSASSTSKGSSDYSDALEKQPEGSNTNLNHPSASSQYIRVYHLEEFIY